MVWTDSQDYGADEILYTARTVLFDKTGKLMREITTLFGVYPQLFLTMSIVYKQRTLFIGCGGVFWEGMIV